MYGRMLGRDDRDEAAAVADLSGGAGTGGRRGARAYSAHPAASDRGAADGAMSAHAFLAQSHVAQVVIGEVVRVA